jgi:hypothetical protein
MAITPNDLKQAKDNLKSAFRDEALVEKFITIRNLKLIMSNPNGNGALTDNEVNNLQSLIARSSPLVQVFPPKINPSTFPPGAFKVELEVITRFKSKVLPVHPFHVIRFARAVQINYKFKTLKIEGTIPGYLSYKVYSEENRDPPNQESLTNLAKSYFHMSKWIFDGPIEEFKGSLINIDMPGTTYSELPYSLKVNFLIALFDQDSKSILEAGRTDVHLCVWKKKSGEVQYSFIRTR